MSGVRADKTAQLSSFNIAARAASATASSAAVECVPSGATAGRFARGSESVDSDTVLLLGFPPFFAAVPGVGFGVGAADDPRELLLYIVVIRADAFSRLSRDGRVRDGVGGGDALSSLSDESAGRGARAPPSGEVRVVARVRGGMVCRRSNAVESGAHH